MPGCDPDIVVTAPGRSPVVIEAEYVPARTVEPEATSRLGLEMAIDGRVIEAAIALRYPDAIGDAHDLHAALSSARLEYCVLHRGRRGRTSLPGVRLAAGRRRGTGGHGAPRVASRSAP